MTATTATAPPRVGRFVVFSLLFHVLYTVSIFDIYFTSPVVRPLPRFSAQSTRRLAEPASNEPATPPANRLVLIVGDGLRADTLFASQPPHLLPEWARHPSTGIVEATQETSLLTKTSSLHHPYAKAVEAYKAGSPLRPSPGATSPSRFLAAPHLRRVALSRGAWGVSHTRVPTESRPGHVALIAGMYEDVSAVTKGWKLNPIAFDSLFNQSSHTFSFGSPDILPMFARGAAEERVHMRSYDEGDEDFTKDATALDFWVLDELQDLFTRSAHDAALRAKLTAPGTVFFLHLLGLDTTGHTYRPHSPEYVGNALVVDWIVSEVEHLFQDFFSDDGKTAFVFSADHGMSKKGNHGDGEPDNTRTPLVAWGSGVRGAKHLDQSAASHAQRSARLAERNKDSYYEHWGALDDTWRQDVEQADITPLMAALLGLPMPANSEGTLPLDYLSVSKEEAARATLANAMQVLETYRVKHSQRAARMLRYVPFPALKDDVAGDESLPPGSDEVHRIARLINAEQRYEAAISASKDLIRVALEGARYLQTYDWLLLVTIVSLGYVGSILYSAAFIIRSYVLSPSELASLPASNQGPLSPGKLLIAPLVALTAAKFWAESSPLTYYAYAGFALLLWSWAINERQLFLALLRRARSSTGSGSQLVLSLGVRILLTLGALELIVVGYFYRIAWTVGFLVLGVLWPIAGINGEARSKHEGLLMLWALACAATGTFTMGGVDKDESVPLLVLSGLLFIAAAAVAATFPHLFLSAGSLSESGSAYTKRTVKLLRLQIIVTALSTAVTASSSLSLQAKRGLPLVNQLLAWLVLVFSTTFPLLRGLRSLPRAKTADVQPASQRLAIILFAFAPVFVLLSLKDETLFFGSYASTLALWARVEGTLHEEQLVDEDETGRAMQRESHPASRKLRKEDVRVALTYLFLLHVGFFGTGNVASISSFYLSPVYRLVPVFSPFLMAALLLLKILVPFVLLASAFHVICVDPPNWKTIMARLSHKDDKHPDEKRDGEGKDQPSQALLRALGSPILGPTSPGGLGLESSHSLVLLACLFTDVLALNFLFQVRDSGSWLEIGRTITHFAMANLLQTFMLALGWVAHVVLQQHRQRRPGGDKAE